MLAASALLCVAAMLVFLVELVARGSLAQTLQFFQQPFRPSWTTVLLFALLIVFIDALLGRAYQAVLIVAPVALLLAFVGNQKAFYLGDPLYPTDFLYARQIVELLPLLSGQRPGTAAAMLAGGVIGLAILVVTWLAWHRRARRLSAPQRLLRLVATAPLLLFFVSIMDYASFSWVRDRLQIIPVMWDQKENYNSNGFAIAFALNVPMAKVSAPKGYSPETIDRIPSPAAMTFPAERPDVIVVMSESFWDPTQLPGTSITPDPIPTVRGLRSGSVFSPEFGGMTSNVEFEALTGFSNAFLPYGSIPYQQYIRSPTPSLAKLFRAEGYATRAIHPFGGWFWNRSIVYEAFGFDRFLSEETLPPLRKRGPLASDEALTEEIIREAEATREPFFFFAVTLQGHGPYEANRYGAPRHEVRSNTTEAARQALETYVEGVADADRSLKTLIDWAQKRQRPTIIAFFGDHLPPLGPSFVETGYMKNMVADRMADLPQMRAEHETPLVLWSNRKGAQEIGSTSPAYLPLHILKLAGIEHPYYTGFLGRMHERFPIVDRNMTVDAEGVATREWARQKDVDPALQQYRMLQHDIVFGRRHGAPRFFPETIDDRVAGLPHVSQALKVSEPLPISTPRAGPL